MPLATGPAARARRGARPRLRRGRQRGARAQRSAAAAKEIKGLIQDSSAKFTEGGTLQSSAGANMGGIMVAVKRVTDIMGEISAASAEQPAGIEQVSTTAVQLDQATQQDAAQVEEAAAAAKALEDQASALAQRVAAFRTAEAANGKHGSRTMATARMGCRLVPETPKHAPVAAAAPAPEKTTPGPTRPYPARGGPATGSGGASRR